MKSSALFTAFVLGAAATVSAQPNREAAPKQEENSERVRLDDTKTGKPADGSPADWIELASPTPAKHGTEFVMVGKKLGAFSRLRIDAAKGKTIVRLVKIYFDDAKPKFVQVDTILSDRRKSTFIELGDAKTIDRIVVNTETHTSGEYAIYGSSADGAVVSR